LTRGIIHKDGLHPVPTVFDDLNPHTFSVNRTLLELPPADGPDRLVTNGNRQRGGGIRGNVRVRRAAVAVLRLAPATKRVVQEFVWRALRQRIHVSGNTSVNR